MSQTDNLSVSPCKWIFIKLWYQNIISSEYKLSINQQLYSSKNQQLYQYNNVTHQRKTTLGLLINIKIEFEVSSQEMINYSKLVI